MVAKIWKKVLLFVLIIACLFNVINKLVHKASMEEEIRASAEYVQKQIDNEKMK
ncbi:MAG: hypothetical protein HFJ28_06530 [Clostridia bacterium]|jgi:hypothetical protein|nr:hypothetical protein [Clostridia bacterium]